MFEKRLLEIKRPSEETRKRFGSHFDLNSRIVKGNLECCLGALYTLAGVYIEKDGLLVRREDYQGEKISRIAEIVLPEGDLGVISKGGLDPLKLFCIETRGGVVLRAQIKYLDDEKIVQIYRKKNDMYYIEPLSKLVVEPQFTNLFQTRQALS